MIACAFYYTTEIALQLKGVSTGGDWPISEKTQAISHSDDHIRCLQLPAQMLISEQRLESYCLM